MQSCNCYFPVRRWHSQNHCWRQRYLHGNRADFRHPGKYLRPRRADGFSELAFAGKMVAQNRNLRCCPRTLQSVASVSNGWWSRTSGNFVHRSFSTEGASSLFLYSKSDDCIADPMLWDSHFQSWNCCSVIRIPVSAENPLAKIAFWRYNRGDYKKEVRL